MLTAFTSSTPVPHSPYSRLASTPTAPLCPFTMLSSYILTAKARGPPGSSSDSAADTVDHLSSLIPSLPPLSPGFPPIMAAFSWGGDGPLCPWVSLRVPFSALVFVLHGTDCNLSFRSSPKSLFLAQTVLLSCIPACPPAYRTSPCGQPRDPTNSTIPRSNHCLLPSSVAPNPKTLVPPLPPSLKPRSSSVLHSLRNLSPTPVSSGPYHLHALCFFPAPPPPPWS